jgi:CBS domain-containing protein
MKASDVMTREVITVAPGTSIMQAARLMLQHRISGLPVVDAYGHLVGVVSEGDFLRRSETATEHRRPRWLQFLVGPGRLAADYVQGHGRKVEEIMTRDLVTGKADDSLESIVDLMERHRVKRVPVVRGPELIGIVSRANVLRAFATTAGELAAAANNDDTIRQQLEDELKRQQWAGLGAISVTVRGGTVHLWGAVSDERARTAAIVAAENVPGVKDVRDHLAWFSPWAADYVAAADANDSDAA